MSRIAMLGLSIFGEPYSFGILLDFSCGMGCLRLLPSIVSF